MAPPNPRLIDIVAPQTIPVNKLTGSVPVSMFIHPDSAPLRSIWAVCIS